MKKFSSTSEISVPKDAFEQIIGQDEAVAVARLACRQRRNLLLVGAPGTGKSMLAQAIAFNLPEPSEEVSVLHNPQNPERPLVEVRTGAQIAKEKISNESLKPKTVLPTEVPSFVAERLGFRCKRCGQLSASNQLACPSCGFDKSVSSSYANIILDPASSAPDQKYSKRVHTTRLGEDGREEVIVYEKEGEKIRVLDQKTLEKIDATKKQKPRKVIVPIKRSTFVTATGASETELLGDVRHDPYGGHHGLGTPPYLRVVPGAVHEAHQGVLFIDELSALAHVQRFILTAMQEKRFSIAGRNPQSSGASVRVDAVPCDFILVAASNINDLQYILPPLRSRVTGNGYEVLLDSWMPDAPENQIKLAQFAAQEIRKDAKIPHLSYAGFEELLEEARRRASFADKQDNALTLRFRELSGIIRLSGDLAKTAGASLIEPEFVKQALKRGRNIETQLHEKYGSMWHAGQSELNKPAERFQQKEVQ